MKRSFLVVLGPLILLIACQEKTHYGHTYPLGKNLEFGSQKVGFMPISETDFSRVSNTPESEFRNVDFGLWYPASGNNLKRIEYIDYLKAFENKPIDSIRADYISQESFLGQVDKLILDKNLSISTNAIHQAKPLDESFPLIIYVGKANDFVYGNTVLFEYIASHGYVVLSLPPKIPKVEQESMSLDNLKDIRFAVNVVKRLLPFVDVSRMATIAYEIGGVSAMVFTIENPNVKAHVSLQGAVGSDFGWSFSKTVFKNNPSDIKTPVLHFGSEGYERETNYIMGEASFETADSIYNTTRYFSFLENSVPLGVSSHLVISWVNPLLEIKDEYEIDKSGIAQSYENVLKQTLMFLNLYVKKDGDKAKLEELILNSHKNNFIKHPESDPVKLLK